MEKTKYLSNSQFEAVMSALSSDMTNAAAMGYMIMAARALELNHDMIKDLESMMREKMDFYSAEQAERVYTTFA